MLRCLDEDAGALQQELSAVGRRRRRSESEGLPRRLTAVPPTRRYGFRPPNDRRSAGAWLDGSIRRAVRALSQRGADAGARRPRAHAHLPGAHRGRRVAGAGVGTAAPPGLEPRGFPRGRRLGRGRAAGVDGATRAFTAVLPRTQPVLAPRRRRSHRGADRRRQHRHGVSRRRSRRRFQSAPHRALSRRRLGERRHAGDRPQQGGSRRRIRRSPFDEVRAVAPGVDVHAVSARDNRRSLDALRRYLGHRPHRGAARHRRASASRRSSTGSSATSCCARSEVRESDSRGRHTSTAPAAGAAARRRDADRHAGHARAAAVGIGRGSPARSPTSRRWRRSAGSATAVTARSPAAR